MNPETTDTIARHLVQAADVAYEEAVFLYVEVCDYYRQTPNRPLREINALIDAQLTLMSIGDRMTSIAMHHRGYEDLANTVREHEDSITKATRVLFEAPDTGPLLVVNRASLAHAIILAANLTELLGIVLSGPTPRVLTEAEMKANLEQIQKHSADQPFGGGTDYTDRN